MKKIGLFFLSLYIVFLPYIAFAQNTPTSQACFGYRDTLVAPGENNAICATDYVQKLYLWAVGFAVLASTIGLMWAGYKYALSKGNPSEINSAKEMIVSIVVGLALLLLSYTILRVIGVNLGDGKIR